MEKLIELLNEWQQSFYPWYEFTYKYSEESAREDLNKLSQLKLFIKRLIDNDKINYLKIQLVFKYDYLDVVAYSDYESTLMLLAISENPISDLISYLN